MIPDVNVLVAAAAAQHPHHAPARERLARAFAAAGEPIALPMQVVNGFVRIATNARLPALALPSASAWAFVDALLAQSGVRLLDDAPALPAFRALCLRLEIAGPQVCDAWLAACALHYRETLVTFDRDFARLLPPAQLELLATA